MPSSKSIRSKILRTFLVTTMLLSASLVTGVQVFLQQHQLSLVYGLLNLLIIGWLFIRLYQQATNLDEAHLMSEHDPLTGLCNRRALDAEFSRLWRESMREQRPISALFMDIDHFKIVNDTYGHETGDRVLQAVAAAIQSQLNRPLDLCCRWGGEEFVGILPNTDEPGAFKIAGDIMSAVSALKVTDKAAVIDRVTISIGIASLTVNTDNFHDDLIDMADKAMFKAKLDGRNRVVLYRPGLHR